MARFRYERRTVDRAAAYPSANKGGCDLFGSAVALGDGFLAIGAPVEDSSIGGIHPTASVVANDDLLGSGAVYIYSY